jgi:hypothetical protein
MQSCGKGHHLPGASIVNKNSNPRESVLKNSDMYLGSGALDDDFHFCHAVFEHLYKFKVINTQEAIGNSTLGLRSEGWARRFCELSAWIGRKRQ